MSMRAWVFVRHEGSANRGHIGWAFQWDAERAICGATENPTGGFAVAARDKGAWHACIPLQEVLREFTLPHGDAPAYDAVRVMEVAHANPGEAWNVMSWCELQDYWVSGVPRGRNGMDDAFDVLTALGLRELPWPTANPLPADWFEALPGTAMSLKGLRLLKGMDEPERLAMPLAMPIRPSWRIPGTAEYLRFVEGVERVRMEEEERAKAAAV